MRAGPIDQRVAERAATEQGLAWLYRDTTGSTNADALQHFERHRADVVAVSEAQSAGRGRRGRAWHSPYARNIYCTLGLTKTIAANRQGLLSLVTGLALCRAAERVGAVQLTLKWPNDILHRGHKLGGILIESRALTEDEFFFAIGFGLNVHMRDEEFGHIEQPATSLQQIADGPVDRTELLVESIIAVSQAIREFDAAGAAELVEAFSRYDAYHGKPVEVVAGARRVEGVNLEITEDGQLKLQTGEGVEIHAAAEISLRPRSE